MDPRSAQNLSGISRRNLAINIFLIVMAIYFVTASGSTLTDVSQLRVEVVRAIVERGEVSVSPELGMLGQGGRYYSWFGIGSVVTALPFYLFANLVGASQEFAITFMNQIASAIAVVVVFYFCMYLGFSNKASVLTALIYGLGTIAWPYSKDSGDHALEALFVLLSVCFAYRYRQEEIALDIFLSAISFGMAFLVRQTSIFSIGALALLILLPLKTKTDLRKAVKNSLLFMFYITPFLALTLWYNYLRFGSVFETGYGLMSARLGVHFFENAPTAIGLLGLLVSPGKGFFCFSPVAILFFLAIRKFYKKYYILSISFILMIASYLIFYSRYVFWHGSNAWGPRFIFLLTPFLIIPLGTLFDSPSWGKKRILRIVVYLVLTISVIIQLASVSMKPDNYFYHLYLDKHVHFKIVKGAGVQQIVEPSPETFFDWRMSPISIQFEFISKAAMHSMDYAKDSTPKHDTYMHEIVTQPLIKVVDFWWLNVYSNTKTYEVFFIVSILIILIIAGTRRLTTLLN